MTGAVNKFRVGELVHQYRARYKGNRRLLRGDIGTVTEIFDGREVDESHVKVRFLDGTEEIKDTNKTYYAGKPKPYQGKVIVKWLEGGPEGTPLHQEWPIEMVTELGFALALDPWGELHWLPPRDGEGDVRYGWRHSDQPCEIALQTVC
jgi:hypothetical protein